MCYPDGVWAVSSSQCAPEMSQRAIPLPRNDLNEDTNSFHHDIGSEDSDLAAERRISRRRKGRAIYIFSSDEGDNKLSGELSNDEITSDEDSRPRKRLLREQPAFSDIVTIDTAKDDITYDPKVRAPSSDTSEGSVYLTPSPKHPQSDSNKVERDETRDVASSELQTLAKSQPDDMVVPINAMDASLLASYLKSFLRAKEEASNLRKDNALKGQLILEQKQNLTEKQREIEVLQASFKDFRATKLGGTAKLLELTAMRQESLYIQEASLMEICTLKERIKILEKVRDLQEVKMSCPTLIQNESRY